MKTLSQGSGYLEIDHTHSPGTAAVPAGTRYERDIKMCSHCQRQVVLNPGRVRDRAVCLKCHHYICDACEDIRVQTGACVPFQQVLDRAANVFERFLGQSDHPDRQIGEDIEALSVPEGPRIVVPGGGV